MRIDIVCYDGMDDLDVVGPLEVLRNAATAGADLEVRTVVLTGVDWVTTSHQVRMAPDGTYRPGADLLVVPGGNWVARSKAGAWGEVQRADWLGPLRAAAAAGAVMTSVCTGAMLLAHAGIIGTRRATTHHSAFDDLAATGATVVRDRVVDDGDLVTAGGVTSGIDLALWLVERFSGAALADGLADSLEYRRFRPQTA